MVDVGRRKGAAGGGDRRGIVNVESFALVTTVCTTILHVRDVQNIRDGYPPVIMELSGACEADLLEHGNKGGKGNKDDEGDTSLLRTKDVGTLGEGTQHWHWCLNMETAQENGNFTNWSKLERNDSKGTRPSRCHM